MPIEVIKSLFGASEKLEGARSTVMSSLAWATFTSVAGFVTASLLKVEPWVMIFMACIVGAVFLTYLGMFVYFAVTDPDALRTEKYSLTKMAIQKNLIGDDVAGLEEVSSDQIRDVSPPERLEDFRNE